MKKYSFYVQRMVQLAQIVRFEIIAENKEEADKIVATINDIDDIDDNSIEITGQDYLWDTLESVEGTDEIYDDDDNLIIKEEG